MSYLDPETGSYVGFDAGLAEDAYRYMSLEAINRPEGRVMENPGGTNEKFVRKNLPDYVNDLPAKEKESGRLDELAEEYFLKYIEEDEELRPAA